MLGYNTPMRRFVHNLVLVFAAVSNLSAADTAPSLPAPKAPLSGLIDMGDISFHRQDGGRASTTVSDLQSYAGVFGGITINITWEQLEPSPGTLVTKEIDRVLDDIRAYNRRNPKHPIGARLRVWPGPNAPAWAKHLGGDPVKILHRNMPITVGRFWSKPYRNAWRDLQMRLATRYDSEPLIREAANSSGSSITDEPFILPGDSNSIANLRTAGFTDSLYKACLMESVDDYAGWKTTCIEYPFNPYREIDSGRPKNDMAFTLSVMQRWRRMLGPRGILSNHALQSPIPDHLAPIYDEIRKLGPPISFQTHSPKEVDVEAMVQTGIDCGAAAVEIWTVAKFGGFLSLPPEKLQHLAALFH